MSTLPAAFARAPVGRKQLSRSELAEHQRERILDAAVGVFAKRGYPASTVDHIVVAAKIGVSSFYVQFHNKEDCFLAAFERTVDVGRSRIEASLPAGRRPGERVLGVLAELLALIAEQPLAARLVLVEAQTAGAEALARYDARLAALEPELRRLRKDSPVAAELPDSVEVATLGGVVWFLQQRILRGETEDPTLLAELAEIVIEPYLGRADTAALLAARAS